MPLPPPQLDPLQPPTVSVRQKPATRAILGVFLLAAVVGGAWGLVVVANGGGIEDTIDVTPSAPQVLQRMVVLALCGLANAGCAVGMWSFKRWGVYGVVCASLVAFMVNFKLGGVPVALPGLIGVAATAIFAMALWVEFD